VLAGLAAAGVARPAPAADDGRRAVDVPQLGISVRAPLAWFLVKWGQEDQAFVLRLPQEEGSPPGSVSCRLEVAQGTLAELRKQQRPQPAADGPQVKLAIDKLVVDKLEELDPQRFEGLTAQDVRSRWTTLRERQTERGRKSFELAFHIMFDGTLYTFTLLTDEEHYDAYRADFDDLFLTARFQKPTSGVARLPGGFWLQRDYAFAVWLPAGLQPDFAARGKILLAARQPAEAETGPAELLVLAGPRQPLDLDALQARLPEEITAADPHASVARCQIVPQGKLRALETVVHTERAGEKVAIFTRRFRGAVRNYELRATCPSDRLEKFTESWQRAAESFREILPEDKGGLL
jgi:hypothetical protein